MTSMPQEFNFFLLFDFFVLLVPFEISSSFPKIECSHWFTKDVKWITDKVFREKLLV